MAQGRKEEVWNRMMQAFIPSKEGVGCEVGGHSTACATEESLKYPRCGQIYVEWHGFITSFRSNDPWPYTTEKSALKTTSGDVYGRGVLEPALSVMAPREASSAFWTARRV